MAEADLAKTSETALTVVVVGSSGVGKSALVRAWKECQLPSSPQPTDSAETRATQGNTLHEIGLHFCELGDEASESEVADNLANADVVVLVFDCQRPMDTQTILRSVWLRRVKEHVRTRAGLLLIFNKTKTDHDSDALLEYGSKADAVFEALPASRKERLHFCGLDDVQKKAVNTRAIVYRLACPGGSFTLAGDETVHLQGEREAGEEKEAAAESVEEAMAEAEAVGVAVAEAVTQAEEEAGDEKEAKSLTKEMVNEIVRKKVGLAVSDAEGAIESVANELLDVIAEEVERAVEVAVAETVADVAEEAVALEMMKAWEEVEGEEETGELAELVADEEAVAEIAAKAVAEAVEVARKEKVVLAKKILEEGAEYLAKAVKKKLKKILAGEETEA